MNRGFSGPVKFKSGGLNPVVVGLTVVMVGCFFVAALCFYWISQPTPAETAAAKVASAELELVDVLVPSERIESGTALEPTLFKKESRPALAVGPSHIHSFDELKGAYAASFIAAGQPLLSEYITLKKPLNPIQSLIPEGFRAVTIGVDNTTSVEGWARPGAKVDVVMTSLVNGKSVAAVVVQNAQVLSAGHSVEDTKSGKETGPQTVTLKVSIGEAAKIQLASSSGTLSLALRGDEDVVESPTNTTITVDSILGVDAPRPQVISKEGTVKIDGRSFVIVNGRLVPDSSAVKSTRAP